MSTLIDAASDPQVRASGIGSSDAAAVVGLDPYVTPLDLYLEKIGIVTEREESEPAYWGKNLERVLLAEYARRTETKVLGRSRSEAVIFYPDGTEHWRPGHELMETLRHPDAPWMFAHLDGVALTDDEVTPIAGIEAKTAGYWVGREFGEDQNSDQVPENYLLQAVHAQEVLRGVIGIPLPWRFAVLIAGQKWRTYQVGYSSELANVLLEREAEFLDRVQRREAPPPTPDARGIEALRRLFPEDDGASLVVQPGSDLHTMALQLRDAHAARKAALDSYDEARTHVMTFMGEHAKLVAPNGKTLVRWSKNKDGRAIDWQAIAAAFANEAGISDSDQHRIIESFTTVKPGARVFDAQWIKTLTD